VQAQRTSTEVFPLPGQRWTWVKEAPTPRSSNLSVAGSQATYSSLNVETGAADDDSAKGGKAEGSLAEDDQRRNVSEEQDNLSDISTPTGTPKMAQREYLPEIPGSQSHPMNSRGVDHHLIFITSADRTLSP
jgi:hypothetical protein